jgi:hypothetical protein
MKTMSCTRKRFFFIPLILVAIILFSLITMVLWNALLPVIFHLPIINFWQAAGLLILARLFFGINHHKMSWSEPHLNHELRRKIMRMSSEEKKEFFRKMHNNHDMWQREYFGEKERTPENAKPE